MSLHHLLQVFADISRIVARNLGGPARTYSLGTIDKHHGNDGQVIFWLNALPLLLKKAQHSIVILIEQVTSDLAQLREDISCACCILATRHPRTELTIRHQQIYIVGADESLRQINDGRLQRHLTMVVGRVLRHVA